MRSKADETLVEAQVSCTMYKFVCLIYLKGGFTQKPFLSAYDRNW